MDIATSLNALEDKYTIDQIEEEKEALIEELLGLHLDSMADRDSLNRFTVQAAERFGGIYIPYLFWVKLADFMDNPLERAYIYHLLETFANSDFGEDEQKLLKPLIIAYFAKEKSFEISKLRTKVFEKSHPTVAEYYESLITFVEKNAKSTEMYCEKFDLLKNLTPNFELMGLPITQLREELADPSA